MAPASGPGFDVPSGACDCHAHICGPAARYPYAPERIYTPPDALLPDYVRMLRSLGLERAVLVQPSIYGSDNRAMLDAIAAAPFPCRGVAVIDPPYNPETIERLHAQGIRGLRFNLIDVFDRAVRIPVSTLRRCAEVIGPYDWHLELQLHVDEFPDLDHLLEGIPGDIVIGHFGYPRASPSPDDAGFRALLRLMRTGRFWLKLSAPYRLQPTESDLPVHEMAQALLGTAPDRLLWGSDWPHTNAPGPIASDTALFAQLADWIPDPGIRRRILVDNPTRLYRF